MSLNNLKPIIRRLLELYRVDNSNTEEYTNRLLEVTKRFAVGFAIYLEENDSGEEFEKQWDAFIIDWDKLTKENGQ